MFEKKKLIMIGGLSVLIGGGLFFYFKRSSKSKTEIEYLD